MTAEEYKEEEEVTQQMPPETRQTDTWNKDVGETGKWGARSNRELWIAGLIVVIVIAATATGVLLGTKDKNSGEKPLVGETMVDVETGEIVSAYELPTRPLLEIISEDAELEALRQELASNPLMAEALPAVPSTVAELQTINVDDATLSPYTRAAAWLVTSDAVNAKEQVASRFALAVIYYSTNGAEWTNSDKWLTDANHCDWAGVGCCSDFQASIYCTNKDFDQVFEVDLYKNNLSGPIPVAINMLKDLYSLFMNNNALTGTIPGEVFGGLPHFSKLYLQHNQLTGTIPPSIDGNKVFDTLYLQGNNLGGQWPDELCSAGFSDIGTIANFGIDCDKISCTESCCHFWEVCFYSNEVTAE